MRRMRSDAFSKPALVVLAILLTTNGLCQEKTYPNTNYGLYAGLNLAFGTHTQRIGVNAGFYFYYDWFQSNTEIRVYRDRKNLGPNTPHNELVLSQGLVYAYGKRNREKNVFMSSVSNQTGYDHAFAYTYNLYFNHIRTTQQTGILALQFEDVFFITENDLLARPALDRFRTGAFLLMYQYQNLYQFAINCTMWTGQMGNKQSLVDPKAFSHCYMDSSGGRYTNYSHGILSMQMKAALPYDQNLQLSLGVDAEQIRNAVQNKIIHDMVMLPKKWRPKNNCHIPMIDTKGNPYLYQEDQKIKPAKLYLNIFANPSFFY
jgi:Bacterial toxin 23